MNLIYSEINDLSTANLIDWFLQEKANFKRINSSFTNETGEKPNTTFEISNINSEKNLIYKTNSIYFRRPDKRGLEYYYPIKNFNHDISTKYINQKLILNSKVLSTYQNNKLIKSSKKVLGSLSTTGLNKLTVLDLATDIGLKIPSTMVTNTYEEIETFFYKNGQKIICKSVEEILLTKSKSNESKHYMTKTILIEKINEIKKLNFGHSLFQKYIDKEFEVRSFYLSGELYSAAIFSQVNPKTRIDFRNYDIDNPNKIVPFIMPQEIVNKIKIMMNKLELNVGSIDFIVDKNTDIYFLEINPVGQYDFVSQHCNYNLDYLISKYLLNKNNENVS